MPKKPNAARTSSDPQLTFTIRQEPDPDTDEPTEFGCFSRNWTMKKHWTN